MLRKFLILFVLLLVLAFPCLAEVTVSFAAAGINTEQDIFVYKLNSTSLKTDFIGQYNTTSSYIPLDDNTSYIFTVKPSTNSELSEPDTAAFAFLNIMQTNWKGMVVFAFFIAGILILISFGTRRKKH